MFHQRQSRGFAVIALCVAIAASSLRSADAAEPGGQAIPPALPTADPGVTPVQVEVDPATSSSSTSRTSADTPAPSMESVAPPAPGLNLTGANPSAAAPAPTPAERRVPLLERWWFWTAVAAVGISAFVIVAASSTAGPPQTELGNRVAF